MVVAVFSCSSLLVMLKLRSGRLMDTFGIETKNENKPHAAGSGHEARAS
jgi:hypothetical protein